MNTPYNIKKRTWRELVLARPGMFLYPRWDIDGLHHLVHEIINLAVKAENMNQCTALQVTVGDAGELIIVDDGRGLPVTPLSMGKVRDLPMIEHVLTCTSTARSTPEFHLPRGFLDYLAVVLNVLSAPLKIETHFQGKRYTVVCSRGEIIEHLHDHGPAEARGTRITYHPDPDAFGAITFDALRLQQSLQQLAHEYPAVTFHFEDRRTNQTVDFPQP